MGKYEYCVFWYPRTSHNNIEKREKASDIKENNPLSDEPEPDYWFDIENRPSEEKNEHGVKREDILFRLYIKKPGGKRENEKEVLLKQTQTSRNGLVKYAYNPDLIPRFDTEDDASAFWSAIYHQAKYFYHVHEYHDDKMDSILAPYLAGECDIDIKAVNNPALSHYLEFYEQKFIARHDTLKDFYNRIRREIVGKFDIEHLVGYKKKLDEICRTVHGAHIYYQTLACSVRVVYEKSDRLRISRLNTERQLERIALMESNIQRFIDNAGYTENYHIAISSKKLGLLSILLGVLSILLAIYSFL
jgi:hypothetical protein